MAYDFNDKERVTFCIGERENVEDMDENHPVYGVLIKRLQELGNGAARSARNCVSGDE